MDVDNDDNFRAVFLLFGVIELRLAVIERLSTRLLFVIHKVSVVINIVLIIGKVNNFHPFIMAPTVKNRVENRLRNKNKFS